MSPAVRLRAFARSIAITIPISIGLAASAPTVAIAQERTSAGGATEVTRLADAYVARYVAAFPENAQFFGLPGAPVDRFTDNRLAAVRAWQAFEDSVWAAAERIDAERLAGTADEVTYAQLREALETSRGQRACRQELWPVNPAFGWQAAWAQLADIQPVSTPADRAAALARWRSAGRYLAIELENLREGARTGYTAAAPGVRATLAQLDALLATPVDSLPFLAPAGRDTGAAFRAAFRAAVADSLLPAARRYRDFLRDEYLPRAKPTVTANLDGMACYRALLRGASGVDRDPRELFREIAAQVAADSAGLLELAAQVYPAPEPGRPRDAAWLRARLEADPENQVPTADSVVAFTRAVMARARAALPRAFAGVPATEVALVPFPAYQQPSAPGGQYVPPAADGSRPGTYYYRTHPPVPRVGLAATVAHETWPGHHLQFAVAGDKPKHAMALLSSVPGFVEGWGQYSEWLADELGVFTTPRDRFDPRLSLAPLLLADLGMNVMGWSPEEAERYLVGGMPLRTRERLHANVQLLSSIPGYIASYAVGSLELRRLRREAEAALGPRFDLRAFHDVVLRDGAVPLALVRTRVERWVRQEQARAEGR